MQQTKAVPDTEVSPMFIKGMVDRMAMSYFKYGAVADAYPSKVDAIESLKLRLDKYAATGNVEFLMDVANFAMIEFMHPRHPQAFYQPTDSDQSPGRAWMNGHVGQTANTTDGENIRLGGTKTTTAGGFYKQEGD